MSEIVYFTKRHKSVSVNHEVELLADELPICENAESSGGAMAFRVGDVDVCRLSKPKSSGSPWYGVYGDLWSQQMQLRRPIGLMSGKTTSSHCLPLAKQLPLQPTIVSKP